MVLHKASHVAINEVASDRVDKVLKFLRGACQYVNNLPCAGHILLTATISPSPISV